VVEGEFGALSQKHLHVLRAIFNTEQGVSSDVSRVEAEIQRLLTGHSSSIVPASFEISHPTSEEVGFTHVGGHGGSGSKLAGGGGAPQSFLEDPMDSIHRLAGEAASFGEDLERHHGHGIRVRRKADFDSMLAEGKLLREINYNGLASPRRDWDISDGDFLIHEQVQAGVLAWAQSHEAHLGLVATPRDGRKAPHTGGLGAIQEDCFELALWIQDRHIGLTGDDGVPVCEVSFAEVCPARNTRTRSSWGLIARLGQKSLEGLGEGCRPGRPGGEQKKEGQGQPACSYLDPAKHPGSLLHCLLSRERSPRLKIRMFREKVAPLPGWIS
jgi:hypothetical protein